ncbi:Holliday junction resolvase [Streptomyces phage Bmoc]|uniref:Holliday junction resolvase n=1 Tax=Streptomyces phage Bmoc TaxID=2725629 RepID=A0A6M3T0P1_9CAUD|nr:Holliday junction resolvase [Streptomyces phage Bmoc]QJD50832.1 Holliday junction resolvase [Streptomyces phage Bmoc]
MSEENEIRRDGGKAQKNSGRGQYQKGDAKLGPFCYDIKEYANSFSVSKTSWGKVCTDAFKSGRMIPALKLVLGAGNQKVRLWVIGDDMFKEMLEAWEEKYGEASEG